MNSEFVAALEQLNSELGIPLDELTRTVEQALADAYRRAFDPPGYVIVHIDPATAVMQVTSRTYGPDGEEVLTSLPTDDFARMAAQTAKQAVLRHIRNLEREKAVTEAAEHRGELATGVIDRVENGTVHLDMGGRAEGVMAPEEQIPGEEMRPGKPLTVVILDTRRNARQPQVQVSRASRLFVRRLLEAEVPEIKSGAVAIKAIAREPGLRSKVAVHAEDPSIDAVGAHCWPSWAASTSTSSPGRRTRRRSRRPRSGRRRWSTWSSTGPPTPRSSTSRPASCRWRSARTARTPAWRPS